MKKNTDVHQTTVLKRLSPWQRLEAARKLYWFARGIVEAREKRKNPGFSKKVIEEKVRSFF